MEITTDDYETINAYAKSDRSWYARVSTKSALESQMALAEFEVAMILDDFKTARRLEKRVATKFRERYKKNGNRT